MDNVGPRKIELRLVSTLYKSFTACIHILLLQLKKLSLGLGGEMSFKFIISHIILPIFLRSAPFSRTTISIALESTKVVPIFRNTTIVFYKWKDVKYHP